MSYSHSYEKGPALKQPRENSCILLKHKIYSYSV